MIVSSLKICVYTAEMEIIFPFLHIMFSKDGLWLPIIMACIIFVNAHTW